jgi:hypothetical protein
MRERANEPNAGWKCNDEKLRALIVLDDGVATKLSNGAGNAFFRGFIVEDRETHQVCARFRFRYADHDAWFSINPSDQADVINKLADGLREVLTTAAAMMGMPVKDCAITRFDPPDDGGDFNHTIAWLLDRDLMEITTIEITTSSRMPREGG